MELNQYIDATILNPSAKIEEYEALCCDAIKYNVAAICIPPSMVGFCHRHLLDYGVKIASVVGFPNGYSLLNTKLNEIEDLIEVGAVEIDFVINRSFLADRNYTDILAETKMIVDHCRLKTVVSKWIIEASILQEDELKKICSIANDVKPDFVKTSTGVHGKARLEDVLFLRKNLYDSIHIKASGGISTREQAIAFVEAGATRLGTSHYELILK
jgi:deoxyribose-phosphate aldolase